MDQQLSHLKRHEVDDKKWNECIDRSPNGLVYAYTFYLDKICHHWDALVLNDYECVMPVVWKKKYGIRYIYDPPFIQRLGVFGNTDQGVLSSFYRKASRQVSYINAHFSQTAGATRISWKERMNYILPLNKPYEEIRKGYVDEAIINIRKAVKRGCVFAEHVPVNSVIDLYKKNYGHYHPHVLNKDYQKLFHLSASAVKRDKLTSCGVVDQETEELLFGALLFRCNKRIYYSIAAPSREGRKKRAGYFFIDEVLRRNAESPMIFDFEGSMIDNVAAFYQRFGPVTEKYYKAHMNRLPWPFSLLKK